MKKGRTRKIKMENEKWGKKACNEKKNIRNKENVLNKNEKTAQR